NSYVNLKIATCLVRYADDRLIDQRFPRGAPAPPSNSHESNRPNQEQKTREALRYRGFLHLEDRHGQIFGAGTGLE
ncbi:hypothetical protein, partial [Burkholderia multivorans]|uniref:hypothetical protein n=1 Tax=Burkholderia multivorans TaxID=87883 RepID=UPI001C613887